MDSLTEKRASFDEAEFATSVGFVLAFRIVLHCAISRNGSALLRRDRPMDWQLCGLLFVRDERFAFGWGKLLACKVTADERGCETAANYIDLG